MKDEPQFKPLVTESPDPDQFSVATGMVYVSSSGIPARIPGGQMVISS
jgi:hypothetical protein